jgi:D-sedoheptulose 7-phosphate isomerase
MQDDLCHQSKQGRIYVALMTLSQLASTVADTLEGHIEQAGKLVADCLLTGNKVLACGNGGSAADAQHFVAELVGRMSRERRALAAVSLSTDPSVVTALGNDYGYERVFARQVEGLGQRGDLLLAISTSGRSANVLRAIEAARQRGLRTIALVGASGDSLLADCDVCIHMPSPDTQRVQELHTAVLHAICDYVEQQLVDGHEE